MVVGLTIKYVLLDDNVKSLVKSVPVTIKLFVYVFPLTHVPKFNDDLLVVMTGTTHVPVILTVLVAAASPPLIERVAL